MFTMTLSVNISMYPISLEVLPREAVVGRLPLLPHTLPALERPQHCYIIQHSIVHYLLYYTITNWLTMLYYKILY